VRIRVSNDRSCASRLKPAIDDRDVSMRQSLSSAIVLKWTNAFTSAPKLCLADMTAAVLRARPCIPVAVHLVHGPEQDRSPLRLESTRR
jgi:hypothetical protein